MNHVWSTLTPLRILPYPKWEPPEWWDPEDYEDEEEDKLILQITLNIP